MLQVKSFNGTEEASLNEFIKTVELSGNIHIRPDGTYIVFYYEQSDGLDIDSATSSLSKELAKLQTERMIEELEYRYWEAKQILPSKQNEVEASKNKNTLNGCKLRIEKFDNQIRGVKQLMGELRKKEYIL